MDPNKNFVYDPASENVFIDRRKTKMIYKFNINNTETKEKYYKADGKIRKIRIKT